MKTKLFIKCICALVLVTWGSMMVEAQSQVVNFTLVDADTDADIQVLGNNSSLDQTTLPANLSVRANVQTPGGSIKFELSGAMSYSRIENIVPYALFGDNVTDYYGRAFPTGSYTLKATPYSSTGGLGTAGNSYTVNFSIVKPIVVTGNITPVVSLDPIPAGNSFSAPANVTVTAQASDPDGSISKVEFYNGSSLVATATKMPYTTTMLSLPAGNFSITAKAYDNLGLSKVSAPLALTVKAPTTAVPVGKTYYISSSSGNDLNDGLSPATAWASFTYLTKMTLFPSGSQILLKAGDEFYDPLTLWQSTTPTDSRYFGRYGTGADPIIYGDHPKAAWTALSGHPGIYISPVFGGSADRAYDSHGKYLKIAKRDPAKVSLADWLSQFTVGTFGYDFPTKLTYIHTFDNANPAGLHLFQNAVISISAGSNKLVFDHLDLRNASKGLLTGASNVTLQNCNIQDIVDNGINLQGFNCVVANCNFSRIGETMISFFKGGNHWAHHNKLSHTVNSILGLTLQERADPERCGFGFVRSKGNLVEYNQIDHVEGSFFDIWWETGSTIRYNYGFHAEGGACSPDGTGLTIHDNIFDMDGGKGISIVPHYDSSMCTGPNMGSIRIFNNLIYDFTNYGFHLTINADQAIIRNNIVMTDQPAPAVGDPFNKGVMFTGIPNIDYNCYLLPSDSIGWSVNGQSYKNFADYQKATGRESHSKAADPMLGQNYVPALASPCVDSGQNLKADGLISINYTDYRGVPVPSGSTTDIGPFEQTK